MKEEKRNELESQLRKLIRSSKLGKRKRAEFIAPSGTGTVIRRRKGRPDVRISLQSAS
jgi:hypothetical protein